MPLTVSAPDRRLFMALGLVLVLLIVAAVILTPSEASQQEIPSSYSTASSGGKAAYLLLSKRGYRIEQWLQSPLELRAGQGSTLILAEPSLFPTDGEKQRLHQFVEDGGRLIATGPNGGMALPLSESTANPMGAYVWKTYQALAPSAAARVAPQITMLPEASWGRNSTAVRLYGDDEEIVAIKYPFGKGEVIWWASATPLSNAGLKEPGNLEFFLTCIGRPEDSVILWDEYFHGHRGSSVTSAIINSQFRWILAQFALLALAVIVTFSRRSGPVRALARKSRLSPLEFVETLGGLYERAEACTIAVDVYYRRLHYFLIRRLGLAVSVSDDELARAVHDRWRFDDENFATALREANAARSRSSLPQAEALRLVRTLHGYAAKLKMHTPGTEERHE